MSPTAPTAVPSGWYPDPAGGRMWRVWTGTRWSDMTRDYGPVTRSTSVAGSLSLLGALYTLVRYGVAGIFGGIGLVVSVLAHWPGTARPATMTFCAVSLGAAVGMLAVGTACFAFAGRELAQRWALWTVVPGVNVIVVSVLISVRLGARPGLRVGSEVVLMVLFASWYHQDPWLVFVPAVVAIGDSRWITSLIDRLTGPSPVRPAGAP